jgi:hypothetical protein
MGLNFYDYDGLQPKNTPPKHISWKCTYLTTYHLQQVLPYNVQYFEAFLDPPTYPKIGRLLWVFPKSKSLRHGLIELFQIYQNNFLTAEM